MTITKSSRARALELALETRVLAAKNEGSAQERFRSIEKSLRDAENDWARAKEDLSAAEQLVSLAKEL